MRWSAAQTLAWILRRAPLDLRKWTSDMGPELAKAKEELSRAISEERLTTWGAPRPQAPQEPVPPDLFRNWDLVVNEYGELGPRLPRRRYRGPLWTYIGFDTADVMASWPKPPPQQASQWMLAEANRLKADGRKGKRDDLVPRCRAAVGCTKREAERAYRELPEEFRRPRGKPPNNSGSFWALVYFRRVEALGKVACVYKRGPLGGERNQKCSQLGAPPSRSLRGSFNRGRLSRVRQDARHQGYPRRWPPLSQLRTHRPVPLGRRPGMGRSAAKRTPAHNVRTAERWSGDAMNTTENPCQGVREKRIAMAENGHSPIQAYGPNAGVRTPVSSPSRPGGSRATQGSLKNQPLTPPTPA